MNKLVLLLLGELPVNRTGAMFRSRANVQNLALCNFGKRCCLHCLLNKNTYVLDSEWHWIFDCPHFSALRSKYPILSHSITQVKTEADGSPSPFAVAKHVGDLMNVIQLDFSVGTSLASMIHKMIQLRKEWLVTVGCARGRLCEAPDSWGRDIFFTPPSAAELTPVIGADFESGRPWHFRFENQNMIFSS